MVEKVNLNLNEYLSKTYFKVWEVLIILLIEMVLVLLIEPLNLCQ